MNFDENSWDLEDILGSDGEDDDINQKLKEEEEDSVVESPSGFTLQPTVKKEKPLQSTKIVETKHVAQKTKLRKEVSIPSPSKEVA